MEKNLKILMIGSDRNLFVEGSAVSARLAEYGELVQELHIVVMNDASEHLKDKQIARNVWIYPTNSFTSILRPIDAARLGKRLVLEKKFVRGQSLITCQDIESGWAGLKIKKKWRIPLEVQVHTDLFSPYFSGFQNRVRKFFAKNVLNNADSIRVVSENLKSKIKNFKPGAHIYVLPVYVDKEALENGRVTFDVHARFGWHFVILSVGRLTKEKNFPLALAVLAGVRKRFPNTGLVIAGAGPEEERLKALVKKLNLEGYVAFEGWQKDLASYYKTSNLFLQTSFFEGNSIAAIEAALSELPIVMAEAGIAGEFEHGKDALIYTIDRPDLFVNGIIDLIENNQKRENLRFNMKKAMEEKLLSKEEYLAKMKENWENTAKYIK